VMTTAQVRAAAQVAAVRRGPEVMTLDAGEAAIRNVIAIALMEHDETSGRGLDALFAMRQAEAIVKALGHAGYEIRRRN
jgi:hypothetical protein